MNTIVYNIAALILIIGVILGIKLMNSPKTAVKGNMVGAISMLGAVIVTLIRYNIIGEGILYISIAIGAAIGYFFAIKVSMLQMPQLVALFNGFGGGASAFVALVAFLNTTNAGIFNKFTGSLALIVGGVTLSGSLVAAGKLDQKLPQRPIFLKGHTTITGILLVIMIVLSVVNTIVAYSIAIPLFILTFAIALIFGVIFTIRVGGADMPVTISLLNSFSGVASSLAGFVVNDPLLVAVGGIVGAAGLILTQIMCRAMNRSLIQILTGKTAVATSKKPKKVTKKVQEKESEIKARKEIKEEAEEEIKSGKEIKIEAEEIKAGKEVKIEAEEIKAGKEVKIEAEEEIKADTPGQILNNAKKVVIVPGYGMALAQAQHKVKTLAEKLEDQGKEVKFAIHPVAGRMPGHMNVLLAEADVSYDKLYELEEVNPEFKETDVVIVVGANDVINPAAIHAEGTPIYGMPILRVDEAKYAIICNYDTKPGYSGVDNPLYEEDNVTMLLGDAAETLKDLDAQLDEARKSKDKKESKESIEETKTKAEPEKETTTPGQILNNAKKVIIVPGYGMALAQAQHKVKTLAEKLEDQGKEVKFAIHPVAGRMPGHMNVLLAEADVSYDKLYELEEVNPEFKETDVVIVVGANDVINPAAIHAEGTPIYGMPILRVDEAKYAIICNYDTKPGYSGVDNPLYEEDNVTMLLGDAADTLKDLDAQLDEARKSKDKKESKESIEETKTKAEPEKETTTPGQILNNAKKVIIVPGYGMALAQAQHKVKTLAEKLEDQGKEVKFAIHPVAGRMPGHMNVLLAEADVSYDKLYELEEVNPEFKETDVVIVVGANDVINPAAIHAEGTPIYGMPILRVDEAKYAIICNYDTKPGYSGVDNPLYEEDNVTMLLGDAADTLKDLDAQLDEARK